LEASAVKGDAGIMPP